LNTALGILRKRDEQLVLLRRELHRFARESNDPGGEVYLELSHGEPRVARPVRPAKDGAHARNELVVDERAHDVVVATPGEAAHAIDGVAASADDDHRHIPVPAPPGLAVARPPAELEAGGIGVDLDISSLRTELDPLIEHLAREAT
jgi:hypothetical protein